MSTLSPSRSLLAVRAPDGSGDTFSSMIKAEKDLTKESEIANGYQIQKAFDEYLYSGIFAFPLSEELLNQAEEQLDNAQSYRPVGKAAILHPAVLGAIGAVLVIIAAIWLGSKQDPSGFKGDDLIYQLIDIASVTPENQMEVADGDMSELSDTLFMKGIERFSIQTPFKEWPVERLKVHIVNQQPVAQVFGKSKPMVFLFEENRFKMELDPPGKWFLIQNNEWSAAVQKLEGMIVVLVCKGPPDKLFRYTAPKKKTNP